MLQNAIPRFVVGLVLLSFNAHGQAPTRGTTLFVELGCAACHSDLRLGSTLRERTPDLSSAGLRYNPAYLFDFLQRPSKVRRHLGVARMPDFYLSESEAVALVAFLETQRTVTGQWPLSPVVARPPSQAQPIARDRLRAELSNGLICLTCHQVDGQGGERGIELTTVSYRLRPEWVREYLVAPARFGVAPTNMPPQFFQLTADGRSFHEMMPRAAERIGLVTDALFSLNAARREALEKTYADAKASHPHADAALGERLFRSLNCAACHRHHAIFPRTEPAAPELGGEGLRVKKTWLEGFLKHPQPIRPFGYRPGDGSRMPDFRLADDEVAALSAVLNAWQSGQTLATNYQPHPLSAFARQKAKLLLAEKLSCLGCHQLDGQGGRVGPDLTAVSARLQPDYVYAVITNPRAVAPHSVMPQIPMTEDTSRLLADYLLQQAAPSSNAKYLSAVDHDLIPSSTGDGAAVGGSPEVRRTYLNYCAACHGPGGQGDGYNARYLPVKPTAHADAKYLSARPDDTLFDGIHSGAYVLNKSQLMPAWGQTLSATQIRELVSYLRTLCQCQGPAWSRDNARRP